MTSTIFWRLAWKEYRQQRDLMLAIVIIGALIMAAMLGWAYLEGHGLAPGMAYSLALTMAVFYALGCGATLFASEHERETFAFLRGLPLDGRQVFWPKLAVAVASCAAVAVALMLLAAILTQGRPLEATEGAVQITAYLLMTLVLLAWAVLYSLILRNPLWAVAAAGLSFVASFLAVIALFGVVKQLLDPFGNEPAWVEAWIPVSCLVLLACLLAADVRLGRTWLNRDSSSFALPVPAVLEDAPPAIAQRSTTRTMLWRLVRQWWREAWPVVAAVYGGLVLLSLLMATVNNDENSIGVVWGCLPALIGSLTFFHDQWKQHFRFFAERGVSGRTVWWGRILASLSACLPYFVVLVIVTLNTRRQLSGNLFFWPHDMLVLSVGMFALAEWCSLLFRAGIVGVFAGTAAGFLVLALLGVLRFLGIPDWLAVYLPAAFLLWASWYRAGNWIAERNSWRQWAGYSGLVALPGIVWMVGLAAHRAYEIPALLDPYAGAVVPGPGGISIPAAVANRYHRHAALATLKRSPDAEELETVRLYRELIQEAAKLPSSGAMGSSMGGGPSPLSPSGPGVEVVAPEQASPAVSEQAENPEAEAEQVKVTEFVDRFLEISRREAASFGPDALDFSVPPSSIDIAEPLTRPVLHEAGRLTDAGELEAGRERYLAVLRFVRHLQQRGTGERIQRALAIEQLANQGLVQWAGHAEQTAETIDQLRSMLAQHPYNFTPDYDVAWMREYLYGRLAVELSPLVWNSSARRPSGNPYALTLLRWLPWERQRTQRWFDYGMGSHNIHQSRQYVHNTLLRDLPFFAEYLSTTMQLTHSDDRKARELCLMLLAYRQVHEELPDSLGDLESMYPGQVPANPATHLGFTYQPYGTIQEPRAVLFSGHPMQTRTKYDLGPAKPGSPPAEMGAGSAMGGAPGVWPSPLPPSATPMPALPTPRRTPAPKPGLLPGTY